MDVITFPVNRYTTSGLQILLHGVISLPDATSCDKVDSARPSASQQINLHKPLNFFVNLITYYVNICKIN